MKDAEEILENRNTREIVDDVLKRSGPMQEILKKPPHEYNDYYMCLKVLQFGISANKYNYTNNKNRPVLL